MASTNGWDSMSPIVRGKIASFCDVDTDCVFTNEDCASIYDVPQLLAEQDFDLRICERLGLDPRERDMSEWNEFLRKQNHANHHADKVKIAVVGKYTQLPDAYLSVIEALHHAGVFYDRHVDVQLVDGESLDEQNVSEVLGDASGILVPGGFGKRALEGKILAAEFAREHKIPYLGICLGMQVAVCEFEWVSASQELAILPRMASSIWWSERRTIISGWIPKLRSSLTECCVGLVLTSWAAAI